MSAPALDSLASAHQKSSRQKRLVSVLLLLPLLIYTAVFFVLPIGMMLYRAVSNPELIQAFPRTVQVLEQQPPSDAQGLPGDAVFEAIEQDFIHVENMGVMGEEIGRAHV